MKINFLHTTIITVAIGTIISSCSTSYKTGQTPDDVYYSPVRLQTDNVRREEKVRQDDNTVTVYDNPVYTPEDREVRRRIHNPRYRRYDDRYDNPYGYNGYPTNQNPKSGVTPPNTSQPRKTNLGAYAPNASTTDSTRSYNPKSGMQSNTGATTNAPVRTFSTPHNNGSGAGNLIRKIFTPDNSNNSYTPNNNSSSSNNSTPTRTFESRSSNNDTRSSTNNTSSPSTNSSSSSSTSAPVRTFKKDN